jgi:hypothetical protein
VIDATALVLETGLCAYPPSELNASLVTLDGGLLNTVSADRAETCGFSNAEKGNPPMKGNELKSIHAPAPCKERKERGTQNLCSSAKARGTGPGMTFITDARALAPRGQNSSGQALAAPARAPTPAYTDQMSRSNAK